jgi:hypothetical protein
MPETGYSHGAVTKNCGNEVVKGSKPLLRHQAYSISCSANLLALSPKLPVPRSNQPTYLIQNTEWQGSCS